MKRYAELDSASQKTLKQVQGEVKANGTNQLHNNSVQFSNKFCFLQL